MTLEVASNPLRRSSLHPPRLVSLLSVRLCLIWVGCDIGARVSASRFNLLGRKALGACACEFVDLVSIPRAVFTNLCAAFVSPLCRASSLPFVGADAAASQSAFLNVAFENIVARQRVSGGAVSVRHASRRDTVASQKVFATGYWAAVMWIATTASAVVAYVVIELHSLWNWPDVSFISRAIDAANVTSPVASGRVALPHSGPCPDVASIRILDPSKVGRLVWVVRSKVTGHGREYNPFMSKR